MRALLLTFFLIFLPFSAGAEGVYEYGFTLSKTCHPKLSESAKYFTEKMAGALIETKFKYCVNIAAKKVAAHFSEEKWILDPWTLQMITTVALDDEEELAVKKRLAEAARTICAEIDTKVSITKSAIKEAYLVAIRRAEGKESFKVFPIQEKLPAFNHSCSRGEEKSSVRNSVAVEEFLGEKSTNFRELVISFQKPSGSLVQKEILLGDIPEKFDSAPEPLKEKRHLTYPGE